MGTVRMINRCESITAPLQLMRRYVQAHAKIKMITITQALSEDMKKHILANASRTRLQISHVHYHSAVFILFLMIQFLFFQSCQLERLSDFRRTQRGAIRRHAPVIDVTVGSGVCALLNELDVTVSVE